MLFLRTTRRLVIHAFLVLQVLIAWRISASAQTGTGTEILYPILSVTQSGGITTIVVAAGTDDGIDPAVVGPLPVWSIYRSDRDSVGGSRLGTFTPTSIESTRVVGHFEPADESRWQPIEHDLVSFYLPFRISPDNLLFLPATHQISFLDSDNEPLIDLRSFLRQPASISEPELVDQLQSIVRNAADDFDALGEDADFLRTPLEEGEFKGRSTFDVMRNVSEQNLRDFTNYVFDYPAGYMGREVGFAESFATWVVYGGWLGPRGLLMRLQSETGSPEFDRTVQQFSSLLLDNEYYDAWIVIAEARNSADRYEDAIELARIIQSVAQSFSNFSEEGWGHFVEARALIFQGRRSEGIAHYETALERFRRADDQGGESYVLNNIGSVQIDMGDFTRANTIIDQALKIKEEMAQGGEPAALESLGYTLQLKGTVLAKIGQFMDALRAYSRAGTAFSKADLPSTPGNIAYIKTRTASLLSSSGRIGEAQILLQAARSDYRSAGDIEGEADVLDEIAYSYFSQNDYRRAINYYDTAYQYHLSSGEKGDAGFSQSNIGQAYWSLGDYYSAEQAHRRGLLLREEAGDQSGQAYSWHRLGDLYRESGDPGQGLSAYDHASEIYARLEDRASLADVLSSRGGLYSDQKAWKSSLENYLKAETIQLEIGDSLGLGSTIYNIANVYYLSGDYQKARDLFEKSLTVRRSLGDRTNEIYSLTGTGLAEWGLHDYDNAYRHFEEAEKIARSVNSRSDIAWTFATRGKVDGLRGEPDRALQNYKEALNIYREIGETSGEISVLISIAYLDIERGDFAEATTHFNDAEQKARQSNDRNQLASVLAGKGDLFRLQGDFRTAEELAQQSLNLNIGLDNPWGIADSYIALGNVANVRADFALAVERYGRADSIYRTLGDTSSRATPLNNTATIWFAQTDYERALKQFKEVLAIMRSTGEENEFLSIVLSNIGEVYLEMDQPIDAVPWLRTALELSDRLGANRMSASTATILARAYLRSGQLDSARYFGNRAQSLIDRVNEREQVADTYGVIGEVALARNDTAHATQLFERSIEVATSIGSQKYLWRPLYFRGLIARDEGRRDQAIDYLKRSVETIESLRDKVVGGDAAIKMFAADRNKVRVYEALIALLIEAGDVETALGYLEKSNSEELQGRFRSTGELVGDSAANDALEKERELKARIDLLSDQLAREQSQSGVTGGKVERLREIKSVAEEDYIRFVNQTVREQPSLRNLFNSGVNPIELRQRKQKIPVDVAVISYLPGEENLYIFLATTDTVIARVVDIERRDLDFRIRQLYNRTSEPHEGSEVLSGRTDARDMFDLLVAPVINELGDRRYLAIIPGGELSYIPFGLLSGPDGDPLVASHTIFYISDLSLFLESNHPRIEPHVVAFGNADNSLPHAEEEVREISHLFPDSKVYLGREATEDRAKDFPVGYNVMHFATHGTLDYRQFENSWLTLAPNEAKGEDGRLTLEEIWGITNITNCSLVTLSACNTAISEDPGDGWPINPASAFLQIGVPRVVATLWQVDDEATALMMKEFYTQLKSVQSSVALQLAQLKVRSDPRFTSPYYWAPFVLLGDWR